MMTKRDKWCIFKEVSPALCLDAQGTFASDLHGPYVCRDLLTELVLWPKKVNGD
jgi:hypothetical protein